MSNRRGADLIIALVLLGILGAISPSRAAASTMPWSHPGSHDANSLQIPSSAFAPAIPGTALALDLAAIDTVQDWPRIHHSSGYGSWGFTAGSIQEAHWTPSGWADPVTFSYTGSRFASEPGAYDAWQDASTYWPYKYNNIVYSACPEVSTAMCNRWELNGNNGIVEWDDTLQIGACIVEARAFAPLALFAAQLVQIATTLAAIDRAAIGAEETDCSAPPASVPRLSPSFAVGIDALRVEPVEAGANWALNKSPLIHALPGKSVGIALYYTVRTPSAGMRAVFHLSVRSNGRVILKTNDPAYALSPAHTLYRHIDRFLPRSPGQYTVSESVTVSGQTAKGSMSFVVEAPSGRVHRRGIREEMPGGTG
jgi:hypothetical protein